MISTIVKITSKLCQHNNIHHFNGVKRCDYLSTVCFIVYGWAMRKVKFVLGNQILYVHVLCIALNCFYCFRNFWNKIIHCKLYGCNAVQSNAAKMQFSKSKLSLIIGFRVNNRASLIIQVKQGENKYIAAIFIEFHYWKRFGVVDFSICIHILLFKKMHYGVRKWRKVSSNAGALFNKNRTIVTIMG